VDVFGAFTATSGVAAPAPVRAFDSRAAGFDGHVGVGETVRVPVGADTGGALLNLTATEATAAGYLTAYPCDVAVPPSSNLNVVAGADVANFAVTRPSPDGEVCVYSSAPTHIVVDVMGSVGAG